MDASKLATILNRYETEILNDWIAEQTNAMRSSAGSISEREIRENAGELLTAFRGALERGGRRDLSGPEWTRVREVLGELSAASATRGFTPVETATLVFSLKRPVFSRLRREFGRDAEALADEIWSATELLDQLGLYTTEVSQKSREEIIMRQQEEMLELSTPVVQLWEGVLALPLIGTLDSSRTQVVMQNLLEAVVRTGAEIAIIDITGVPTVDTLVAQHLLKTIAAARLMGADCIISGIRPQIAQTIVHLGVDLANVTTKATLADAFTVSLRRLGFGISTMPVKTSGASE
ncbi:MAG TPA: STAS domain-containing protein [Bryobacteraceae bacterium]|nr:STAS domain-containing protein [Bryobacteraceae bacterium]